MAQSLARILIHIVFSTKERRPLIGDDTMPRLHGYLAKVCQSCGCDAYQVGGTADHVHMLVSLSRTIAVADLVRVVKRDSSHWMKSQCEGTVPFAWQNGYGAFSLGHSQKQAVVEYIVNQADHHAERSFQDEFRALLRRYQVDYDERYVWD